MRVEKNIFVDRRYIASHQGIVATADTFMEAIDKVLVKIFENEPVRGFCYHIDCDEDRCRCWSDLPALREYLRGSKKLQKDSGLDVSIDRNRVVKLNVIHLDDPEDEHTQCLCNDPSCPGWGREGEVCGHIEECPCNKCHHALGKL